jgi:hypothetical protein
MDVRQIVTPTVSPDHWNADPCDVSPEVVKGLIRSFAGEPLHAVISLEPHLGSTRITFAPVSPPFARPTSIGGVEVIVPADPRAHRRAIADLAAVSAGFAVCVWTPWTERDIDLLTEASTFLQIWDLGLVIDDASVAFPQIGIVRFLRGIDWRDTGPASRAWLGYLLAHLRGEKRPYSVDAVVLAAILGSIRSEVFGLCLRPAADRAA